ncbi:hypothetical protein J4410_02970 [Candidatus Woesearchaeota archaeon]|nr:hypothetical protein [Candidatus Woesearchaeota archaeon]
MAKARKRLHKSITYVQDLERDLHKTPDSLRFGMIHFLLGMLTGAIVTTIVIYYVL